MWALEKGMYLAAALFTAGAYVCVVQICGLGTNIFACVIIGLAAGMAIGKVAGPPPPPGSRPAWRDAVHTSPRVSR